MPRYVIERSFANQLGLTKDAVESVKKINDEEGVAWIFSFLSADKKKTYCLYEASNPDAIRAAARRNNLPADVIVEVGSDIGPAMFNWSALLPIPLLRRGVIAQRGPRILALSSMFVQTWPENQSTGTGGLGRVKSSPPDLTLQTGGQERLELALFGSYPRPSATSKDEQRAGTLDGRPPARLRVHALLRTARNRKG